jgi:hypothetical protein
MWKAKDFRYRLLFYCKYFLFNKFSTGFQNSRLGVLRLTHPTQIRFITLGFLCVLSGFAVNYFFKLI